ncbi:MAG: amidohydrolase family protein [Candidatus Latescibacteria bacterium]|nr:amidohydrolase family protein [Candidatus Latescibacterota bacterium]
MSTPPFDLVVRAGRVFCSATELDGPGAVAICGDRIIAAGPDVGGPARTTLDFPDGLLLPGLVDLHAHPARGQSRYGVDPDVHFLPRGVTTVMSQGDAGALNIDDYRRTVIETSHTRVLLAINLSKYGESHPKCCFNALEDADAGACAEAIAANDDSIWGIAVTTSSGACADLDPRPIMQAGLEASQLSGKPLLVGTRLKDDWARREQLALLRPGDVVTYCLNALPENLFDGDQIADDVWAARQRGVLFDLGHGMNSFSFPVAEASIAQGFLVDTVSTDQYNRHLDGRPQHDLPRTMSKLIAAGMDEREVFARATAGPAAVLGLEGEVGTLAPGACADLALLRWIQHPLPLADVNDQERPGGCWEPMATVRGGCVV